jgi:hypothetical protein
MPHDLGHEPKPAQTIRQRLWQFIIASASWLKRQLSWRNTIIAAVLGLVVMSWGVYYFLSQPIMGAHVFTGFDGIATPPIDRKTSDGTPYKLYPGRAIIGCDVLPDDAHSQRVFPSHGAAMLYAREHGLPTVPSVSSVLAACRVADARLQIALEHDLEKHADGRAALLNEWLAEVVRRRALAPAEQRTIHDRATQLVAQAIRIGGGSPRLPDDFAFATTTTESDPGETPIGPWSADATMAAIWHRDHFLAQCLSIDSDENAAVAAVLARSLVANPNLTAGWHRQSRVAAALVGKPSRPTLEHLADALATVTDHDLTSPQTCAQVRLKFSGEIAPAYAAWASSPEEATLSAAGMNAWADPFATLIDAIRSGALNLTPNANSGFYRRWWYALEPLAAPERAPERGKLQLTAAYTARWQTAFAAGFTDGRSGIVKRMPVLTLGGEEVGIVTAEVAPAFSCEPAPAVYLRLARAYRVLAHDLSLALGDERWRALADSQGQSLATAVEERSARLFGIAAQSYREIGFPMPLTDDEHSIDQKGAAAQGLLWCSDSTRDPDVAADARHLVTLTIDGDSHYRCPAIVGVRLEPVRFSWVEKPAVGGNIDPVFVPVNYWLTAPCVLATTVEQVPSPDEFRRKCDRHDTVAALYAAFGETPTQAKSPTSTSFSWWIPALAMLVLSGCIMGFWGIVRLAKRRCWKSMTLVVLTLGISITWLFWAPPYWLARMVAVHVLTMHENIALAWQRPFTLWAAPHLDTLFYDLLDEPDPQLRYWAVWLHVPNKSGADLTQNQINILELALNDGVEEVAYGAWFVLCRSRLPSTDLLSLLAKYPEFAIRKHTIPTLARERYKDPAVIAHMITQAGSEHPIRHVQAYAAISTWRDGPTAELITVLRTGITHVDPKVRRIAVSGLGTYGIGSDLPAILALLADPESTVRIAAFQTLYTITIYEKRIPKTVIMKPHLTASIGDPLIQSALTKYVQHPNASFAERMSAARWLYDADLIRKECHDLMALVNTLPSSSQPYLDEKNGYANKWTREQATIRLVIRYFLAEFNPTRNIDDENRSGLENNPWLLERLTAAVHQKASFTQMLEICGEALNQNQEIDATINFIRSIGAPAATLRQPLADLHDRLTDEKMRWWTACALADLGPDAASLAIPRLKNFIVHPDHGDTAKWYLDQLQPTLNPTATDPKP